MLHHRLRAASGARDTGGGGGGDPFWDDVVLLLQFDGDMIDQSGVSVFSTSGAVGYEPSDFGEGAVFAASSIYTSAKSQFAPAGDYTIEAFIKLNTTGRYHEFVATGTYDTDQVTMRVSDTNKLQCFFDGGGSGFAIITGPDSLQLGAYNHVAITRHGNITRTFLNGVQQGQATAAYTPQSVGNLRIGQRETPTAFVDSYLTIDSVRFTNGTARYTENFTPPASPFPSS